MNLRVRPRVKLRKFKDRFHYQLSGFYSFLADKPSCFQLGLNLPIRLAGSEEHTFYSVFQENSQT